MSNAVLLGLAAALGFYVYKSKKSKGAPPPPPPPDGGGNGNGNGGGNGGGDGGNGNGDGGGGNGGGDGGGNGGGGGTGAYVGGDPNFVWPHMDFWTAPHAFIGWLGNLGYPVNITQSLTGSSTNKAAVKAFKTDWNKSRPADYAALPVTDRIDAPTVEAMWEVQHVILPAVRAMPAFVVQTGNAPHSAPTSTVWAFWQDLAAG